MSEWQPIETAPKNDGINVREILLLFDNGKVSVAYWDAAYAQGGRYCTHGVAWIEPVSGEQLRDYYDDPVGWMPIPGTENEGPR